MTKSNTSRTAICMHCKREFLVKAPRKVNKHCSFACRHNKPKAIRTATCIECKLEFVVKYPRNPNKYCSRSCQGKHFLRVVETPQQQAQREQNRIIKTIAAHKGTKNPASSRRMKENNPMSNPEALAKMTATQRAKKTWLGERGGNGFITQPQMLLAEALFLEEFMEYPISMKTARPHFKSLPTHYSVDIAVPELKIAIEVDGKSHKRKKWRYLDKRKTEVLNWLGWTVLRFWNEEVNQNLSACTEKVKQCMISRLKEITTT